MECLERLVSLNTSMARFLSPHHPRRQVILWSSAFCLELDEEHINAKNFQGFESPVFSHWPCGITGSSLCTSSEIKSQSEVVMRTWWISVWGQVHTSLRETYEWRHFWVRVGHVTERLLYQLFSEYGWAALSLKHKVGKSLTRSIVHDGLYPWGWATAGP